MVNFADMAFSAYEKGRAFARQKGVESALSKYGTDPLGAENELLKYGAFDESNTLRQRRMQTEQTTRRQGYATQAKAGTPEAYDGIARDAALNGDTDIADLYSKFGEQDRFKASKVYGATVQVADRLAQLVPEDKANPQASADKRRGIALEQASAFAAHTGMPEEIVRQRIEKLDFSDNGIAAMHAQAEGLGLLPKKNLQIANRGNGGYDVVDLQDGKAVRSVDAYPEYRPVTVKDAAGNEAVYGFNPLTGGASGGDAPTGGNMQISPNVMRVAIAEDPENIPGVLSVIMNRARATGKSPDEIVAEPNQFEAYGNGRYKNVSEAQIMRAMSSSPDVAGVMGGNIPEKFKGATHFYAPEAQAALGRSKPAFDDGSGFDVGRTRFFNLPYGGGKGRQGAPAVAAPGFGSGVDPKQDKADREGQMKLRKEFDALPEVKQYNIIATTFDTIKSQAKTPSPASDIGLIFSYMRMLDPNSVVREGEFATAQNAASIPEQIRNSYNKALNGQRLNDAQRKDFVRSASQIHEQARSRYDDIVEQYKGYASDSGYTPENVLRPRSNPNAAPNVTAKMNDAQRSLYRQVFKPGAEYGKQDNPFIVNSDAAFESLRSGSFFITPDGKLRGPKP